MTRDPVARVRAFYQRNAAAEDRRLGENRYRRLELDATVDAVRDFVPRGGRILDVGGGPGRYLEALAPLGYDVRLCDLAPAHVTRARRRARRLGLADPEARAVVADARDLSAFAGGAFDAVLACGPFYHLSTPGDQRRALAEAVRVVRPGGALILAILPRLHPLRYLLREGTAAARRALLGPGPGPGPGWTRFLATGRWKNPTGDPALFTDACFWEVDAFCAWLGRAGLAVRAVRGVEGFAGFLDVPVVAAARREREYRRLYALVRATAERPESVAMSEHVLVVARTPAKKGRR